MSFCVQAALRELTQLAITSAQPDLMAHQVDSSPLYVSWPNWPSHRPNPTWRPIRLTPACSTWADPTGHHISPTRPDGPSGWLQPALRELTQLAITSAQPDLTAHQVDSSTTRVDLMSVTYGRQWWAMGAIDAVNWWQSDWPCSAETDLTGHRVGPTQRPIRLAHSTRPKERNCQCQ